MKLAEKSNFAPAHIMKAHSYRDGVLGYPQDFVKAKLQYPIPL